MSKKPLVIIGSARKESETRKFVDKIFEGAEYSLIDLLDLNLGGYDYTHGYPKEDDFGAIVQELLQHQTIVFATPVYWYSMSSLMKTLFDRFSDLVTYRKAAGRQLKGKSTLLIAVGAEEVLPTGYEVPFKCTSEYLDMQYMGSIYHCTSDEFPAASIIDNFRRKL